MTLLLFSSRSVQLKRTAVSVYPAPGYISWFAIAGVFHYKAVVYDSLFRLVA